MSSTDGYSQTRFPTILTLSPCKRPGQEVSPSIELLGIRNATAFKSAPALTFRNETTRTQDETIPERGRKSPRSRGRMIDQVGRQERRDCRQSAASVQRRRSGTVRTTLAARRVALMLP